MTLRITLQKGANQISNTFPYREQQVMLFPNMSPPLVPPSFLKPSKRIKGLAACKISVEPGAKILAGQALKRGDADLP